jgi:hypothetical protein
LLRVSIERLCAFLGAKGREVNEKIADQVAQGLPPLIQQSLDSVRVIGNNAVHPGTMGPNDVDKSRTVFFKLINFTVEDRITSPRMVADRYAAIPERLRLAIDQRDGPNEPADRPAKFIEIGAHGGAGEMQYRASITK